MVRLNVWAPYGLVGVHPEGHIMLDQMQLLRDQDLVVRVSE
jgi:hypothetical protein